MRRALAQESFAQKIRKVSQLIQLAATLKSQRIRKNPGQDKATGKSSQSRKELS